ncbi:MAG: hypothetical protein ABS46_10615 [Cytophagaceae bacterium SCN 52-12]|nr:MAG: hypothetical protein ABS46_10615 [Cytophagaceae bacterium SCN 52-12]
MELNSLVTIVICVLIVTAGSYMSIRAIVKSYTEKKVWEHRIAHQQLITPLRIQAGERMCLFLERITPNNLIVRLSSSATTALELHQLLLREIREEFNHNVAQQIYIGTDTWDIIRNAKEEVITIINLASQDVAKDASAGELAREIMKRVIAQESSATSIALATLKKEMQELF